MGTKESARTGFVERATVEIIEQPAALADDARAAQQVGVEEIMTHRHRFRVACGWYWYNDQPVLVFEEGEKAMVRGYDFTKKEEWRVEAASLPLELLRRIG